MSNAVKAMLAFSLGAATGSLVAWKMLKSKYERITQEEIDSYREYAKKKFSVATEETKEEASEDTDESDEDGDALELSNLLGQYRSSDDRKEEKLIVKEPYVIAPDEYDTLDGYDCTSLTYYADGVIADEWDNVIENPDDLIGEDVASHFGEYEADSVFIRNESIRRDFEILRDLEPYGPTPRDAEE